MIQPESSFGFLSGDTYEDHFNQLFGYYHEKFLGNPVVEDPEQLALEKAYKTLLVYSSTAVTQQLTYTIVRLATIDEARSRNRRPTNAWLENGDDFSFDYKSPESVEDVVMNRWLIEAVISEIPIVHQQALLLTAEGYNQEEIAEILDIAVGTVKSRVNRGREYARQLRDKFEIE